MLLKKLNNVGRYIKYDGKPPMPDDEIIELTIIQHEKELAEKEAVLQKERERVALIKLAKLQMEKAITDKKHADQKALDDEESMWDGELDYLDGLTIPCPKCGDDIMRKESECSALACGKRQSAHVRTWQYSNPTSNQWSFNTTQVME